MVKRNLLILLTAVSMFLDNYLKKGYLTDDSSDADLALLTNVHEAIVKICLVLDSATPPCPNCKGVGHNDSYFGETVRPCLMCNGQG